MISPRAIALQGIGSSALLVAVQGLWPADVPASESGFPNGPLFIVNMGRMMSR